MTVTSNNSLVYRKVPRGGWGRQSEDRAQQPDPTARGVMVWDVLLTDSSREVNEYEPPYMAPM